MRDSNERLGDMLEAITRIERHAARGRASFEQDELLQIWVVHHLQIVGEAAARLGRDFHAAHPQIAWAPIIAMRNVLVHDYFGVDAETVWAAVERDLPELKRAIQALLDEDQTPP